jgi:serine/threonine-protein kinase
VASLETGELKYLIEGGGYARYTPTGQIIYGRPAEADLLAVPFDLERLDITGSAMPVLDSVMMLGDASAQFALSETGSLVYVPGGGVVDQNELTMVNRRGDVNSLPLSPSSYGTPRFSPDGNQVAFSWHQPKRNLWIYELERGILRRFTDDQAGGWGPPLWTRDGKRIVMSSIRAGVSNLVWKPTDGSGTIERLTNTEHGSSACSWSPDGKILIYQENARLSTGLDIWHVPLEGDRTPRPFLRTPDDECQPSLSPDGGWLAYSSNLSGRHEVYVRPYPDPGGVTQISTFGALAPLWAPDGRELFYQNLRGDSLLSVPIRMDSVLHVGEPKTLFTSESWGANPGFRDFDVSPDGQRFIFVRQGNRASAPKRYNVVMSWFEELQERVSGSR